LSDSIQKTDITFYLSFVRYNNRKLFYGLYTRMNIIYFNLISGGSKQPRGKLYHMFCTRDKTWKFADVGYKSQDDVVSVTLPAYKDKIK